MWSRLPVHGARDLPLVTGLFDVRPLVLLIAILPLALLRFCVVSSLLASWMLLQESKALILILPL